MGLDTLDVVDARCEVDENGRKRSYCPHGCEHEDLDDNGYCEHLLGFTNDGVNVEPVTAIMYKDSEGVEHDTGNRRVLSSRSMKFDPSVDTLVNPQFVQVIRGTRHVAKMWVSARVYRKIRSVKQAG